MTLLGRWRFPFYYGWIIVVVVFLAEFTTSGMGGSTLGLFFVPMNDDLGWSLTTLAGAVTAQSLAAMVTAPLIGPMLDRYGARPVMLVGAISAGMGLLLLMGIQAVWHFWLLYAIVGALGLNELGRLSGPVVVAKWFIRRRGRAMALATSGSTFGGWVMAPIIAALIVSVGWRYTWGILGATLLVLMVPPVLLFMKRQPEDIGLRPDGDDPMAASVGPGGVSPSSQIQAEPVWTLREAVRTRTLWLLILAMNLVGLSAGSLLFFQVPYLVEEGMSTQNASYVFTATWVGFTFSRVVWGFSVERIPVRICLAGAFMARSLGPLILVVVPYPVNIVPFILVYGLFGGSFGLLQAIAFADYYGRRFMGSIQGTMRPLLSIPSVVGPVALAAVHDYFGNFDLAFLLAAALGFVAVGVVLLATPPIPRPPAPAIDELQPR